LIGVAASKYYNEIMKFSNNYEFVERGTCSKCAKKNVELVTLRRRMQLLPGLCRGCSPKWPSVLSRNAEILRWHSFPSWESARALLDKLEDNHGNVNWVECESLSQLDKLLQDGEAYSSKQTLLAYVHKPEEEELENFPSIERFLDEAFYTGAELHIAQKGSLL